MTHLVKRGPALMLAAALALAGTARAADRTTTPPATQPATPAAGANGSAGAPGGAAAAINPAKGSPLPIDVNADQAIEWHQNEKAYVARGNASATRGDTTVYADVLTAFYRDVPHGGTEIFRLAADGHVRIKSPTDEAFGDRGIYDIDRKVAVLTGDHLKLVTQTDIVTARDDLEYWDERKLAVARGDAVAVRIANQNRIRADVLIGEFQDNPQGQLVMNRMDARGNVVVTTQTDIARGDQGVYDLATDIAVLTGDVKITRGQNQINGAVAEVNMKTGISRMLTAPGAAHTRVHGLFVPGQKAGTPQAAPQTGNPPAANTAPSAAK